MPFSKKKKTDCLTYDERDWSPVDIRVTPRHTDKLMTRSVKHFRALLRAKRTDVTIQALAIMFSMSQTYDTVHTSMWWPKLMKQFNSFVCRDIPWPLFKHYNQLAVPWGKLTTLLTRDIPMRFEEDWRTTPLKHLQVRGITIWTEGTFHKLAIRMCDSRTAPFKHRPAVNILQPDWAHHWEQADKSTTGYFSGMVDQYHL